MKKFWNLMLAAMVIFGAVACNDVTVEIITPEPPQHGVSFDAANDLGADETRTDVVYNEGTGKWDTVWTATRH